MVSAFFQGIGFGLLLAIMVGPVFFGLLQTSISKGFRQGVFYALGVSFSDITLILLTYFGISKLLENHVVNNVVTIIGGIITIIFGIVYLFKPVTKSVPLTALPERAKSNIILKGFLHNFLNPSVLFFWIGTVSLISVNYENQAWHIISFFSGIILTLFSCDVIKSYIAHKIKIYVTEKILIAFNKILGGVFILAGCIILAKIF